MIIKSILLNNYRNFKSQEINFNSKLNIFLGNNGQGKTNILEAIYLIGSGKSFRYSKNENLINLNESSAFIKAKIENENLDYSIFIKLTSQKKEMLINEKAANFYKNNKLPIVLFSPESLSVIKESSDERRQLVDQLVEQVCINGELIIKEYKKILKSRNKILKDIMEEKIDYKMGVDTLDSINQIFLKTATELTILRIKTLNKLKPEIEKIINEIENKQSVSLDFNYLISDKNFQNQEAESIMDAMRNRIKELQFAELKIGLSLVGPQKHDITFLYNGNDSRFYCSQGQQRSIILAYKMAQIVYHKKVHGFYPLLLLDDVLSELDLPKQEALISNLNQTETQTFVTTTDISLLSKLSMNKASVFKIENGQVVI